MTSYNFINTNFLTARNFEKICGYIVKELAEDVTDEPSGNYYIMADNYDGGVESKCTSINNNRTVGIQCKNYNKIDQEIRSLEKSFYTMLKSNTHSDVTDYIWCSTAKLTTSNNEKIKKTITKLRKLAKDTKSREINVFFYDLKKIESLIIKRRPSLAQLLSGSTPINFKILIKNINELSVKSLSQSETFPYTKSDISKSIDLLINGIDCEVESFMHKAKKLESTIFENIESIEIIDQEIPNYKITDSSAGHLQLASFIQYLTKITNAIDSKAKEIHNIGELPQEITDKLWDLLRSIHEEASSAVQEYEFLEKMKSAVKSHNLNLVGSWGIGKTFEIRNYLEKLDDSKFCFIFIRARDLEVKNSLQDSILELAGESTDNKDFLIGLDWWSQHNSRKTIVVLDGINECPLHENKLVKQSIDFSKHIAQLENIYFLTTTRNHEDSLRIKDELNQNYIKINGLQKDVLQNIVIKNGLYPSNYYIPKDLLLNPLITSILVKNGNHAQKTTYVDVIDTWIDSTADSITNIFTKSFTKFHLEISKEDILNILDIIGSSPSHGISTEKLLSQLSLNRNEFMEIAKHLMSADLIEISGRNNFWRFCFEEIHRYLYAKTLAVKEFNIITENCVRKPEKLFDFSYLCHWFFISRNSEIINMIPYTPNENEYISYLRSLRWRKTLESHDTDIILKNIFPYQTYRDLILYFTLEDSLLNRGYFTIQNFLKLIKYDLEKFNKFFWAESIDDLAESSGFIDSLNSFFYQLIQKRNDFTNIGRIELVEFISLFFCFSRPERMHGRYSELAALIQSFMLPDVKFLKTVFINAIEYDSHVIDGIVAALSGYLINHQLHASDLGDLIKNSSKKITSIYSWCYIYSARNFYFPDVIFHDFRSFLQKNNNYNDTLLRRHRFALRKSRHVNVVIQMIGKENIFFFNLTSENNSKLATEFLYYLSKKFLKGNEFSKENSIHTQELMTSLWYLFAYSCFDYGSRIYRKFHFVPAGSEGNTDTKYIESETMVWGAHDDLSRDVSSYIISDDVLSQPGVNESVRELIKSNSLIKLLYLFSENCLFLMGGFIRYKSDREHITPIFNLLSDSKFITKGVSNFYIQEHYFISIESYMKGIYKDPRYHTDIGLNSFTEFKEALDDPENHNMYGVFDTGYIYPTLQLRKMLNLPEENKTLPLYDGSGDLVAQGGSETLSHNILLISNKHLENTLKNFQGLTIKITVEDISRWVWGGPKVKSSVELVFSNSIPLTNLWRKDVYYRIL